MEYSIKTWLLFYIKGLMAGERVATRHQAKGEIQEHKLICLKNDFLFII